MTGGNDTAMSPEERRALHEVRRLEPLFHVGTEAERRERFERLTAPDFREVGASGRAYTREEVWRALAERGGHVAGDAGWETGEWRCRQVGTDTFLVTYLLQQDGRASRRLTVWERHGAAWRAVYHQGTLAEASPPAGEGDAGVPLGELAARAERVWRDPAREVAVVFLPGRAVAGWLTADAGGAEHLVDGEVIPDTSSRAMEQAIVAARERRAQAVRDGRLPGG